MEAHENEQYVSFPLSGVHDSIHETIISHEEICEPVNEYVLQEGLNEVAVTNVNAGIAEVQVVEILPEQSDEENDNQDMYPILIKQEEQQQYTSGDDETMAVETLCQLGGIYPNYEDKKLACPHCANLFTQSELTKHSTTCATNKLSCVTCGEHFERKLDLNNHMVCHQVDRPHACRTCGNLFRSKNNLRCHMLQVHQTEKPHKCSICGSSFQRPSSLSNHMKIHTYVAGRAIMQAQSNNTPQSEEFRSWSDNVSEPQNTQVPSSSIQTIQNYDSCQVQWNVPSYSFSNEQTSVNAIMSQQDKLDTLQEFTVMSNGEVTQFEYTQQSGITSEGNNHYTVPVIGKVETLAYDNESKGNYTDVETGDVKLFSCKQSGIGVSNATELTIHEKLHNIKNWGNPIDCKYCDKQFQDANYLATHHTTCAKKLMQNSLEQGISNSKWGKHACSECGKKFTTKQKMFRHQWIHRKKTHSCEVCGSQFEKQSELDEHRLAAHPGDSPFTCSNCGKSFVSRQGLWEHGRTHDGSPPHFRCDKCSKTFSSRQGYLIHHRTHTGERPYGCKFCWKAFRDGGTLRKHERIHTGERPHVCPLCSRAFNQKVVLREHVRWVHAAGKNETEITGPPFPCPLCDVVNQDRDELCAHIVKHSDQMIAKAKAKTNNHSPKSSPAKKRFKSSSNTSPQERQEDTGSRVISKSEQNEALLSITETIKTEDQEIINNKRNNAFLVVAAEKQNEEFIAISQIRTLIEDKQEEHVSLQPNETSSESMNMIVIEKEEETSHIISTTSERSTLHPTRQNEITGMHLIQTSKPRNTLHLISKHNESLPVLTIRNPVESHVNFSSQMGQINNTGITMNMVADHTSNHVEVVKHEISEEALIQEDTVQTPVIQVVQYHGHDSDDCGEVVCGTCGEDFANKDTFMEHIKIHK